MCNNKRTAMLRSGKSLSEALIFASTNPQYDDRLFIELQVQSLIFKWMTDSPIYFFPLSYIEHNDIRTVILRTTQDFL